MSVIQTSLVLVDDACVRPGTLGSNRQGLSRIERVLTDSALFLIGVNATKARGAGVALPGRLVDRTRVSIECHRASRASWFETLCN
jgi:hypothetical protein